METIVFIIKRYFTGVFYLLTGQWSKLLELAANEDLRKK